MPPKMSKTDGHDKSPEFVIGGAFSQAHGLRDRVLDVARRYWQGGDPPGEIPDLLSDISRFILSLQTDGPPSDYPAPEPSQQNGAEPSSKKRKLDEPEGGKSTQTEFGGYDSYKPTTDYELKDVSVTAPLRKKMRLQFSHDSSNLLKRQFRLLDSKTGSVEYILRGEDVDQIFMLPVPDKAQRQQNFLLFPRADCVGREGTPVEPLLFTINEVKGTPEVISSSTNLHGGEDETLVQTTLRELNIFMASLSLQAVTPAAENFASEIPQSHRKGEKGYHVKAFKGSKEGYLFFLRNGIVFGFKKPLAFFPFAAIESISFTSVLARTFNLVITTVTANNQSAEWQEEDVTRQEHEFSMIDIVEFGGIDTYIKTQGLNDASMAAERRAKILNVNKDKKTGEGAAGGVDGAADGEEGGELAKAEQMLQDQEDEEEEDYDPSEGESDGSGESSEEEEGYEDGHGEEMEEVEEEEE